MEATIERVAPAHPVGFAGAVGEQVRLLWQSRRPLLMFAGLVGVLALAGEPWSESDVARLFRPFPVWLVFAGPFWGFAVWHNEGPASRLYFWSHPVSRSTHTLARVVAGAVWLVAIYAALIGAAALLALFDGNVAQLGHPGPVAWLDFFLAPLIGYLIISVLTVPSDYPIRWFLAVLLGVPITLALLDEWLGMDRFVEWLLEPLTNRTWGLAITMGGPFILALERLGATLREESGPGPFERMFDPQTWWVAVALWLLFWAGLVVLLASRHPDALPRVRRRG